MLYYLVNYQTCSLTDQMVLFAYLTTYYEDQMEA